MDYTGFLSFAMPQVAGWVGVICCLSGVVGVNRHPPMQKDGFTEAEFGYDMSVSLSHVLQVVV